MNQLKNGHITEEEMSSLVQNTLDADSLAHFMEHIATCDFCAEHYAAAIEKDLISTPPDFKKQVLDETRRIPTALQSARVKFYRYCFRVGLATCVSLFLIFSGTPGESQIISPKAPHAIDFNLFQNLGSHMRTFSEKFIYMEDNQYDQEKR